MKFKAGRNYRRLDHFLKECLPEISRSKIEKLIAENRVKLNNQLVTRKNLVIVPGNLVEIEFPKPEKREFQPTQELKKLYDDEYLLIIDKPAGIPVHGGAGETGETILDIFAYYYPQVKEIKDTERPGIVHRLDKDTSGVLVLAKDERTQKKLQKQFKKREIKKTYLALVAGRMRHRNGTIAAPIMRSRRQRTKFVVAQGDNIETAREAVTDFSVIREFKDFSFIKLFPYTGRTHQIRVHLSHYGSPILGDRVYGKGHPFERLALHAFSIEFLHPINRTLVTCRSPLPPSLLNYLKAEIRKNHP